MFNSRLKIEEIKEVKEFIEANQLVGPFPGKDEALGYFAVFRYSTKATPLFFYDFTCTEKGDPVFRVGIRIERPVSIKWENAEINGGWKFISALKTPNKD